MGGMNITLSPDLDLTYPLAATGRLALPGTDSSQRAGKGSQVPYRRVPLVQGTPAWLEWRSHGIGASDAPTLMGENPFATRDWLMRNKLANGTPRPGKGRRAGDNRMALGVSLEPEARAYYCRTVGERLEPVCLESTERPWLRASLDGLSAEGDRVVEIKCGQAAYAHTVLTGQPPEYYYGQLQHVLAVTGLSAIDFVCYFPPLSPICITIQRDDGYIEQLLRKEEAFWNELTRRRA
jgi:putative phage-type endonuclease